MATKVNEGFGARPLYGRYSHVKLKAHQANERTLIFWVFVGLMVMVGSVPTAQFNREIDTNPFISNLLTIKPFLASSIIGLSTLIFGVVIAVLSCFRYVRARHNIEEGIYKGPDFFHLAFLGAILFFSLFIGLAVMEIRGAHWADRSSPNMAAEYSESGNAHAGRPNVPIA